MPTLKTARINMAVKPYIKQEIVDECNRADKEITQILLEGWELYKRKHHTNQQKEVNVWTS